jgi:hypothetical protein
VILSDFEDVMNRTTLLILRAPSTPIIVHVSLDTGKTWRFMGGFAGQKPADKVLKAAA